MHSVPGLTSSEGFSVSSQPPFFKMFLQNTGMIGGEGFRFTNIRWLTNKNAWHSAVRDSVWVIYTCVCIYDTD
jgi:hypothetical protein